MGRNICTWVYKFKLRSSLCHRNRLRPELDVFISKTPQTFIIKPMYLAIFYFNDSIKHGGDADLLFMGSFFSTFIVMEAIVGANSKNK